MDKHYTKEKYYIDFTRMNENKDAPSSKIECDNCKLLLSLCVSKVCNICPCTVTKENEDSAKCYEGAIRIYHNYGIAFNYKGCGLYDMKKYDESIKCFDEALRINPKYIDAFYNKGSALRLIEKYQEAVKCYDEAIKFNSKHSLAFYYKGISLYYLEKYQEAIKCYDETIRLSPQDCNAYNNKLLEKWVSILKLLYAMMRH